MKKLYTLLFASLLTTMAWAQVPNGSFEEWETPQFGGEDSPVGWSTLNTSFTASVLQSMDATDGMYSMQLAPLTSSFGNGVGIATTDFTSDLVPDAVTFDIKPVLDGPDSVRVVVNIQGTMNNWAGIWQTTTSSDWNSVSLPVDVNLGAVSGAQIVITIGYMTEDQMELATSVDSYVLVDNFSFGTPIGIEESECEIGLVANGPSSFALNNCGTSNLSVRVIDLQGRVVYDETNINQINLDGLQEGIYLVSVFDGSQLIMTEKKYIR